MSRATPSFTATSALRLCASAVNHLLLWAATMVAATAPAHAIGERDLGLDEMVALADDIVVGRVLQSNPRWQGRLIVTVSTVAVGEALKGSPEAEIEVTQLGGTAVHPRLGVPVTMSASEETTLSPGEDVVLFIRQTRPGTRQLVGGTQGKFVVRPDSKSGVPSLPGAPRELLVHRYGDRRTVETTAPSLATMRERISAAVARQTGTQPGRPR